jgi:hypothetical protein
MLIYSQSEGIWTDARGVVLVNGCLSGNDNMGHDMNNPDSQFIRDRGPLPRGEYTIGPLEFQPAVRSDGCVLTPDPTNIMGGRSGFYLHLRNLAHVAPDGTNASSDGCITFSSYAELAAIFAAAEASDHKVMVVASLSNLDKGVSINDPSPN